MNIMDRVKEAIARAIAPHITSALPPSENEALKAEINFLKSEIERLAKHSRDEEEFRGEVSLIAEDHFYSKEEIIEIFNEEIDLEEAIHDLDFVSRWEVTERTEEAIDEWRRNDLEEAIDEMGFLSREALEEAVSDLGFLKEETAREISERRISEWVRDDLDYVLKDLEEEISKLKGEISELKAKANIPWWKRLF